MLITPKNGNKANLDLQAKNGVTALMIACVNNVEIVKMLITHKSSNKANLDLQNIIGCTALMIACYNDNVEIASYLLEYM